MDDTEHNAMNHRIYMPLCSAVLTPFYFNKNLQKGNLGNRRQFRFNAFVEQLYLHSSYYMNNDNVLEELDVKPKEYVIVRYIAYDAHHDLVAYPLSEDVKKQIVKTISKYYRVLVSLEKDTNDAFYDNYLLRISPEKMHDLEAQAKFLVTEGATMASESFVHGVPYLYLNPLKCGYIDYQCNNYPDRCFQTTDEKEAMDIIDVLLRTNVDSVSAKQEIEKRTIDPTLFFEHFVEKYPDSKYQNI